MQRCDGMPANVGSGPDIYVEQFRDLSGEVQWRAVHIATGVQAIGPTREQALANLERKLKGGYA